MSRELDKLQDVNFEFWIKKIIVSFHVVGDWKVEFASPDSEPMVVDSCFESSFGLANIL